MTIKTNRFNPRAHVVFNQVALLRYLGWDRLVLAVRR